MIRGGEALEGARRINTIVLDKTGTLTRGKPTVTQIIATNGLNDRELLERHLANLPDGGRRDRGQVDPHLAIARAKIEEAETFDEALGYLTARETFAVLNSPVMLRALCAMPRNDA